MEAATMPKRSRTTDVSAAGCSLIGFCGLGATRDAVRGTQGKQLSFPERVSLQITAC
jgi:hypothetical protein